MFLVFKESKSKKNFFECFEVEHSEWANLENSPVLQAIEHMRVA